MLEIKTFGGLSIKVNGRLITGLGSHKAEAILVYLAAGRETCKRETLAAMLWPDSAEGIAFTSLRVALSRLRRHLKDYIEISRETVRIKPGAGIYLDIVDLETKLTIGQIGRALEIYQGEFLQGFHVKGSLMFEDWQRLQQEHIRRKVIEALHTAISEALDQQDCRHGQPLVHRLLEIDPLDELAYRKSMLLFAQLGERAHALEQYQQCQAALQSELGVEPSPETYSLYDQISKGIVPRSDISLSPPLMLPSPQTSFVDREAELAQVIALVGNPVCRLLSLTGPGGIGKTRLAIAAATQCHKNFPDGTYFIPLETVTSPEYLVHEIAAALHFKIDTIATQLDAKYQLFDYLKNRSVLLVMDGFEHLVSGSEVLANLLEHAARVKILVTTRQRLDLKGEWVFPVTGLPVPGAIEVEVPADTGAMQLFAERACQSNVDFSLTEEVRKHTAQICQLVEGMPLGIELAAAWTSTLSPQEIAREIQNNIDFLSASWRDAEQKHHSLRATFDSSWQRLGEELQDAFDKLSVFQGGFDRKAALGVAGIELNQLSGLLDRSMLNRDNNGRFSMHGLLRQYGIEKLKDSRSDWEELQDRHCRYYTSYLTTRSQDLLGSNMFSAADEIRLEMGNIRNAVNWAVLHWEGEKIRPILMALLAFYCLQGWHEGKDAFNEIARVRKSTIQSQGEGTWMDDAVYLCASTHQAFLLCNLGQIDESDLISKACLEPLRALGLKEELSECIHNLGVNVSFRGRYEHALELLQEAIQLGHDSHNPMWPTYLLWFGHAYFLLGEYDRGLESLQKCYELFKQGGNLWGMAFAMSKMGLAADGLGEFHQARQYHHQALKIFEKTGNQAGKAYALSRMSMSEYFLENYTESVRLADEGYQIFQPLGHHWGICTSLCRLGFGYIGLGEVDKGEGCFRQALENSRKYQMIPLSLYALAGMAACLVHRKGEVKTAVELFHYARNQPQIPAIYIQQTARWFEQEQTQLAPAVNETGSDTLDDIITRILKVGDDRTPSPETVEEA